MSKILPSGLDYARASLMGGEYLTGLSSPNLLSWPHLLISFLSLSWPRCPLVCTLIRKI